MNEHVFKEWFSFEETCPTCNGTETVIDAGMATVGNLRPCGCDHGKVPTAFGLVLLDFLRRRLFIKHSIRIDVHK